MNNKEFFLITIWPNSIKYFDNICDIIGKKYQIAEKFKCVFIDDWAKMIDAIYKDDKVSLKNLNIKKRWLSLLPKIIFFIIIKVDDPKYRYKKDGRKISTVMEMLKKDIRSLYGNKKSPSNPIHIVDEAAHSNRLLERIKIMEGDNELRLEPII